jgi:hypothetical protein
MMFQSRSCDTTQVKGKEYDAANWQLCWYQWPGHLLGCSLIVMYGTNTGQCMRYVILAAAV